jgi:hypothetical protein
MIKLDNRGRRANNEELAQILHQLNPGDMIKVYGDTEETIRLANSLSRTHKAHNKNRFMVHKKKTGGATITCVKASKPKTIIIV